MSDKTVAQLEAEANDDKIEFKHNGLTFKISKSDEWGVDVIKAYEEGKSVTAIELVLGAVQFGKFKKSYGGNPTVKNMAALAEDLFEALDSNQGE